ncbi:MAG TPA: hypothetical protein VFH27_04975 [Longimicrobiaceae bacterium]|nr:hypothetical protein [Longimicrobiaceae bacterium]
MACNYCETTFQGAQSVVVSINRAGTTGNLYVQNQGRNIVLIRRILFCYTTATGSGVLYLRAAPDPISWTYPSTYLEPGITALYYSLNIANVQSFQAQAEYVEIEGRSRSCVA